MSVTGTHCHICKSLFSAYAAHGYVRHRRMDAGIPLKTKYINPLVYVLLSIIYKVANYGKEANMDNGNCMVIGVYNSLLSKLCATLLYGT